MVRAKFKCCEKTECEQGKFRLKFCPVYGGSPENEKFYHYTPGGGIDLMVVNQEIADNFKVGSEYYIDFTPAG